MHWYQFWGGMVIGLLLGAIAATIRTLKLTYRGYFESHDTDENEGPDL